MNKFLIECSLFMLLMMMYYTPALFSELYLDLLLKGFMPFFSAVFLYFISIQLTKKLIK